MPRSMWQVAHLNLAKVPDNAPVGYYQLPAEKERTPWEPSCCSKHGHPCRHSHVICSLEVVAACWQAPEDGKSPARHYLVESFLQHSLQAGRPPIIISSQLVQLLLRGADELLHAPVNLLEVLWGEDGHPLC